MKTPAPRILSLAFASLLTLACGGNASSGRNTPGSGGAGGDTQEGGSGGDTTGGSSGKGGSSGSGGKGGSGGDTGGSGGSAGGGDTGGSGGAGAGGAAGDDNSGNLPDGGTVLVDAGPTPDVMIAPPPPDDTLPACKRTVMVANTGDLATKLGAAQPGDCLVLADGTYTFPTISNKATDAAPIVVRAQNRLKVSVPSLSFSGASHVVLEGMVLSGTNVRISNSDYCRISRFSFKPAQDAVNNDWISMSGSTNHTRIDHNDLGPKNFLGNIVMFSGGANAQVVQYNRVDHNYFHDVKGGGGNGWESLRVGLSGLAGSKGFNIIEANLFHAATGDPETISLKSCDNTVRYNTFRATNGEITLRHGNRALIYGNFIFADGLAAARGIRVCGSHHKIFNNYIEGVTASAAIALEGGDADGGPGDFNGAAHFRVYDTQVVNNTIVNGRGISVGASHPDAPTGCVVANNLFQNPTGDGITNTASEMTTFIGNISSSGAGPGIKVGDPKLVKSNGAFRITMGSAAIDAEMGSYPYVMDDMDGQPRMGKLDVGADELADGALMHHPLTEADVGPDSP